MLEYCFKQPLRSYAIKRVALFKLLTFSLCPQLFSREINPESIQIYESRKREYQDFYSRPEIIAYENSVKNINPTFPFCFEEELEQNPNDPRSKAAHSLAIEAMNSWIQNASQETASLQCKGIQIIQENHICPNCYIEKELRINEAIKGEILMASEGSAKDSTIYEHYDLALFPLLGQYTKQELSQIIYGIDNSLFLYFTTSIDLEEELNLFFNADPNFRKRLINFHKLLFNEKNPYTDLESSITSSAAAIIIEAFNKRIKAGDLVIKDIPQKHTQLLEFMNFVKDQLQNRDIDNPTDYEWIKNVLLKEISNKITFDDLLTLSQITQKTFIKEKLQTSLRVAGLQAESIQKIQDFVESDLEISDGSLSQELFTVVLRNLSFATKALKLCKAEENRNKTIAVQMGAKHGPGVAHLLNSLPQFKTDMFNEAKKFKEFSPEERQAHLNEKQRELERIPITD